MPAEGLVSATVATGVVSRGVVAAAVGSVSATVATTEVSRGMVGKCEWCNGVNLRESEVEVRCESGVE